NPATGRYRQGTSGGEVGQSFTVRFDCTDSGTPPASTSQSATIRVVQAPPIAPTPTPQPTPVPCRQAGAGCSSAAQCCGGRCDATPSSPNNAVCCLPPGARCSTGSDLCCRGSSAAGCACFPPSGAGVDVCCGGT